MAANGSPRFGRSAMRPAGVAASAAPSHARTAPSKVALSTATGRRTAGPVRVMPAASGSPMSGAGARTAAGPECSTGTSPVQMGTRRPVRRRGLLRSSSAPAATARAASGSWAIGPIAPRPAAWARRHGRSRARMARSRTAGRGRLSQPRSGRAMRLRGAGGVRVPGASALQNAAQATGSALFPVRMGPRPTARTAQRRHL
mmetsp:Transcript_33935/g.93898  ORF Transcript_33935/g.93898 Transcript_33935/m.93898 type:complete len:201 (+) Transcript_33935:1766-2368(+)